MKGKILFIVIAVLLLSTQVILCQNMVIKLPDNLPEDMEHYQLDVIEGITIYFPLPMDRKKFLKERFSFADKDEKFFIRLTYNYDGYLYSCIVGYRGKRPELKKFSNTEYDSEIRKEFTDLVANESTAMLFEDIKNITKETFFIDAVGTDYLLGDKLLLIHLSALAYVNDDADEEIIPDGIKKNLDFIKNKLIIKGFPLEENFNNNETSFIQNENWQTASDVFTFRNGKKGYGNYRTLSPFYSDFTVSVKARLDNLNDQDYGLVFGSFNSDFNIFTIDVFGQVCLSKKAGDKWIDLTPCKFSHVLGGGFKELKVTVVNKTIKCFVNSKLVIDTTDNNYSGGKVGIFAEGDVEVSFDDFKIGLPIENKEETVYKENIKEVIEESYIEVAKEDFDRGTTEFQLNDYWKLEDGALYHSSDEEDRMHWNRITNGFTDCTISVKTKWDGKETNSAFGLRFGDRHCFLIAQDGHFKMSRWTESGWVNLIAWQETDLVSDDYNSLVVTCSGKNIHAYLNNTLVININDDSYTGGYVGVVCSGDVDAYFDDFSVVVTTSNKNANKNNNTNSSNEGSKRVILSENFDGNSSLLKLNQYWKLEKSALTFTNGVSRKTYWTFTDNSYSDFSCSVNAIWSGKENNLGYGLAFGIRGNVTYTFDITQSGYYELSYWNGSNWEKIVDWKKSDLINFGFNNLKVTCRNNRVLCYINNVQVIDTNIDNYSSGRLGLFCCGEVEAAFDDFVVMEVK
jgi:hypothetical protein